MHRENNIKGRITSEEPDTVIIVTSYIHRLHVRRRDIYTLSQEILSARLRVERIRRVADTLVYIYKCGSGLRVQDLAVVAQRSQRCQSIYLTLPTTWVAGDARAP